MTDIRRPLSLQLKPILTKSSPTTRPHSLTAATSSAANSSPSKFRDNNDSRLNSSRYSSSSSSTDGGDSLHPPSQILPYLYVGDQAQTQIDIISSLNIRYILSLQSLPKFLDDSASDDGKKDLLPQANSSKDYLVKFKSCVHKLIKGKCINISDTFETLVEKFFDETHNFIEEARRNRCNILVHCKAGVSRSPTIAIAYIMKWKRLHLQDAYDFVKRCRPQISPNLNFMGQLMSYERRLISKDHQFCKRSQILSPTSCCLPSTSEQGRSQVTVVLASREAIDDEKVLSDIDNTHSGSMHAVTVSSKSIETT